MSASKEEEKKCLEYAKEGQLDSLAGLVERFLSLVHCVGSFGRSPVKLAAWNGHLLRIGQLSVVQCFLRNTKPICIV